MHDSCLLRIGGQDKSVSDLPLKYANRHGLISGATGSGKSVTLQLLAEQFSKASVPVILPDIKGDLIGIARVGELNAKVSAALERRGQSVPQWSPSPVRRWSVGAVSADVSSLESSLETLGPHLLSSLLSFNDTQSSLLQVIFRVARDRGFSAKSLRELRELLVWIQSNRAELAPLYGSLAESSLSVMMRELLVLEEQSAGKFISGSDTPLSHLLATTEEGLGVVNLIDATTLLRSPELYASMFCWLVTRLYEELPEVGDLPKPKLVLFIDEAHLLFEALGKGSQEHLQRSIRLIRSRGVGVYFASQLPSDLPDTVLSQLGHRIQHVLRAFTPRDQKAVTIAAQTMRANPEFDMVKAISSLAPGEALVSCLDENGNPSVTKRVWINVPSSFIGATETNIQLLQPMKNDPYAGSSIRGSEVPLTESGAQGKGLDATTTESLRFLASTTNKHRVRVVNGIARTLGWLLRV